MTRFFLRIYDFLAPRRWLTAALLLAITISVGLLVWNARYEEDIAKFLPRSAPDPSREVESTIAVIFSSSDSDIDLMEEAMEHFGEVADGDPLIENLQVEADETQMLEVLESVYANLPNTFTRADSVRIDSLLRQPDYISRQLDANKRMLANSLLSVNFELIIQYDPLRLFTPVLQRFDSLRKASPFQTIDGYVFTTDGKHSIVRFNSPFGGSETNRNAQLAAHLDTLMRQVEHQYEGISLSAIGAPLIAVTNAKQIKSDATLAIAIAAVLIISILLWHYRRLSDLLWISLTLAFGFAVAIAGTSLYYGSISIIVLGIASAFIGIAANYPLHFLDHYKHLRNRRETLREMVRPLLIGNVTTVAAFFCLVFLDAEAMCHLGLFGSVMLVGTILFVLVFLPQMMRKRSVGVQECRSVDNSNGSVGVQECRSVDNSNGSVGVHSYTPILLVLLTAFFFYFSLQTSFDSDLNHINYMTDQQRSDLKLLSSAAIDISAVQGNLQSSLPSAEEAQQNRQRWEAFWAQQEREGFTERYLEEAERAGFETKNLPQKTLPQKTLPRPLPVREGSGYSQDGNATEGLSTPLPHREGLGEGLLSSFNYIGFVCGFVVFAFLWLSFRRIELALLSFLPLAVGWVWILGSMQLLGLQFNIVNIILATFIFGQGDDYTIFITEGLIYEYTTGRRRLDVYKRSVALSAIIMFIGIGCLVFARHPALQSLGLVTIVGMFTVVLMAFIIPPAVFRWLTMKKGVRREVPITLKRIVYSLFSLLVFVVVMVLFMIPFTWLYFLIGKNSERKKLRYHRLIHRMAQFIGHRIPGVKLRYENTANEDFERPAIIVSNHQSHFDLLCLMTLSPKMVFLTNDWVWRNPLYGIVIHRAECYPVSDGIERNLPRLRSLYERGYSICVFPEGTRSADCSILRFHKGAFYLARELGADILPVFLHGPGHVLPKTDFMLREGTMTVEIGERVRSSEFRVQSSEFTVKSSLRAKRASSSAQFSVLSSQFSVLSSQFSVPSSIDREVTRRMHRYYQQHYAELCQRLETEEYWKPLRRYQSYYCLGEK